MEHYTSSRDAFDKGDFCHAARTAGEDDMLRGAALVMLGNYEDGLIYLNDVKDAEAEYYRAAAYYGFNRKEDADRCIGRYADIYPDSEKGLWLKELIEGRKIRILLQARNQSGEAFKSSFNHAPAIKNLKDFDVITVGMHDNDDIPIEPYETIGNIIKKLPPDWTPDFYLIHNAEFNMIPVGIEKAPFPVIGYIGDYDTRIMSYYYQYQLFDALIVLDSAAHADIITGIKAQRCYTIPSLMGTNRFYAEGDEVEKDIDIFISGTTFSLYQYDKANMFFRIAMLSDKYKVLIHTGQLDFDKYKEHTKRAKIVPAYIRRPGDMPSRSIEALFCGTVPLIQKNSSLLLFLGEQDGIVEYDDENIESVIDEVLSGYDKYIDRVRAARNKVISRLSLDEAMKRYLNFISLNLPDLKNRQSVNLHRDLDKRLLMLRPCPHKEGGMMSNHRGETAVKLLKKTIAYIHRQLEVSKSPYLYNLLGLSYLLMANLAQQYGKNADKFINDACSLYAEGIKTFPDFIILKFNLARIYYHANLHNRAELLFKDIINKKLFQFNPLDHLFPESLWGIAFPYRIYNEKLIDYLKTKDKKTLRGLIDIIISSAYCYLGGIEVKKNNYENAIPFFRRGAELVPAFPMHAVGYSNALIKSGMISEGINSLIELLKDFPFLYNAYPKLVDALIENKDIETAEAYLSKLEKFIKATEIKELGPLKQRYEVLIEKLNELKEGKNITASGDESVEISLEED
jgi:hypothetical protein